VTGDPHKGYPLPTLPYSGIERPGKIPRTGKTQMGEDHGCQTPQNVDLVSNLSPGRSIRTPNETTEITLMNGSVQRYWKAACIERCTCSLGEGSRKSTIAIWQLVGFLSYVESHFNIARRMSDARFARATSWEEVLAIHRTWMHNYNVQRHWAHEKREDGCHSVTRRIVLPPW